MVLKGARRAGHAQDVLGEGVGLAARGAHDGEDVAKQGDQARPPACRKMFGNLGACGLATGRTSACVELVLFFDERLRSYALKFIK